MDSWQTYVLIRQCSIVTDVLCSWLGEERHLVRRSIYSLYTEAYILSLALQSYSISKLSRMPDQPP